MDTHPSVLFAIIRRAETESGERAEPYATLTFIKSEKSCLESMYLFTSPQKEKFHRRNMQSSSPELLEQKKPATNTSHKLPLKNAPQYGIITIEYQGRKYCHVYSVFRKIYPENES